MSYMNYYDTPEFDKENTINEWIETVNSIELYERLFAEDRKDASSWRKIKEFVSFILEDQNESDMKKNESYIKNIEKKIDSLVKLIEQEKEKPLFIKRLIDEGYILPDGRTALTSLENIAEYLHANIESVTPELLVNSFNKIDGKQYSDRTAQDAVKRTKPQ